MHRRFAVALGLGIALVFASRAASARTRVTDVPCAGCVTSWTDGAEPAPVLVVLHGDWGNDAAALHAAWEPLVAARGITLVSLSCPRDQGCQGSFWRWNGSPDWIDQRLDAVSSRRAIDRSRMWLAGWSGGATYIGYNTVELEKRFAALVFHGGGAAPYSATCASAGRATYFLVGDANPLHGLTVALRDHYTACHDEVSWNVLRGADHDGEWRALSSRGSAIVDWLLLHSLPPPASAAVAPSASAPPSVPSPAPTTPASVPTSPAPTAAGRRGGCACGVAGAEPSGPFGAAALSALAVSWCWWRRARRARPAKACRR